MRVSGSFIFCQRNEPNIFLLSNLDFKERRKTPNPQACFLREHAGFEMTKPRHKLRLIPLSALCTPFILGWGIIVRISLNLPVRSGLLTEGISAQIDQLSPPR